MKALPPIQGAIDAVTSQLRLIAGLPVQLHVAIVAPGADIGRRGGQSGRLATVVGFHLVNQQGMLCAIGRVLAEDDGFYLGKIDVGLVGVVEKQAQRHFHLHPLLGRQAAGVWPQAITTRFGIAGRTLHIYQRHSGRSDGLRGIRPKGKRIGIGDILKREARCNDQRRPVAASLRAPAQAQGVLPLIGRQIVLQGYLVPRRPGLL